MASETKLNAIEKELFILNQVINSKTTLSKVQKYDLKLIGDISFTKNPTINGDKILTEEAALVTETKTKTIDIGSGPLTISADYSKYIISAADNFNVDFEAYVFENDKTYSFYFVVKPSSANIYFGNTFSNVGGTVASADIINSNKGIGTDYIVQEITISVDDTGNKTVLSTTIAYSNDNLENENAFNKLTVNNNLTVLESDSMMQLKSTAVDINTLNPDDTRSMFDLTEFSVVTSDSLSNPVSSGNGKTIQLDESTLLIKCKVPTSICGLTTSGYYYLPLLKVTENP